MTSFGSDSQLQRWQMPHPALIAQIVASLEKKAKELSRQRLESSYIIAQRTYRAAGSSARVRGDFRRCRRKSCGKARRIHQDAAIFRGVQRIAHVLVRPRCAPEAGSALKLHIVLTRFAS